MARETLVRSVALAQISHLRTTRASTLDAVVRLVSDPYYLHTDTLQAHIRRWYARCPAGHPPPLSGFNIYKTVQKLFQLLFRALTDGDSLGERWESRRRLHSTRGHWPPHPDHILGDDSTRTLRTWAMWACSLQCAYAFASVVLSLSVNRSRVLHAMEDSDVAVLLLWLVVRARHTQSDTWSLPGAERLGLSQRVPGELPRTYVRSGWAFIETIVGQDHVRGELVARVGEDMVRPFIHALRTSPGQLRARHIADGWVDYSQEVSILRALERRPTDVVVRPLWGQVFMAVQHYRNSFACSTCGAHAADLNRLDPQFRAMKKCGGCFLHAYCGRSCQKNHWSTHKVVCALLRRLIDTGDQADFLARWNTAGWTVEEERLLRAYADACPGT